MIQSWNTIDLSENKAEIHQKWVNNCSLKNRRPVWSPINPNLIDKGGLETANYPIIFEPPKLATQECKVWFKPEWDTELNIVNTFDPQLISITAGKRPVGGYIDPRNPKQIVYKNAIEDGIDLVYGIWDKRCPSFEKVIVFRQCPDREYVDIEFEVKFPGGKLNGLTIFSKGGDKNISFENPVAWYYKNGKCIKCKIKIILKEKTPGKAIFVKRIPKGLIKKAINNRSFLFCDVTGTYYPAASSGGASVDGSVRRTVSAESFSTITSASSGDGTNPASPTMFLSYTGCHSTISDMYTTLERAFCTFGTSGITTSNIVSSATLGFYPDTIFGAGSNYPDSKVVLCGSSLAATNNVASSDYSNINRIQLSTSYIDYSMFIPGQYNNFTLNVDGLASINTAGVSQFSVIGYCDYELVSPAWAAGVTYMIIATSADYTGTSRDPKLTVVYYPPNPKAFLMF